MRHLLRVVAAAGGADNMDKAVAAVRAVNLREFQAMSWGQVAFDVRRFADVIETGELSGILSLVLVEVPAVESEGVRVDLVRRNITGARELLHGKNGRMCGQCFTAAVWSPPAAAYFKKKSCVCSDFR